MDTIERFLFVCKITVNPGVEEHLQLETDKMFTAEEKKILLKTVSGLIKSYRGVGPQSHYIKYLDQQMHIIVKGTLSPVERYMVQTFGQEYIDAIYKFYFITVTEAIEKLDQALQGKHQLKLIAWEPDFLNDQVVYRVSHN